MNRKLILGFFVVLLLAGISQYSFAGEGMNLKVGFFERLRWEYADNYFNLNDDDESDKRNYFRIKTSVWGKLNLGELGFTEGGNFFMKLTNESRPKVYYGANTVGKNKDTTYEIHELFFDNFYLELKNILDSDVTLKIGRQDFKGQYANGFILIDGTGADGSRSFFFDAIRARWAIDDANTLDFIVIDNDYQDNKFSRFNQQKGQKLNLSDNKAFGIVLKSKVNDKLYVEPYYFNMSEKYDNKTELDMIGSYLKYKLDDATTLRLQLAYQDGKNGGNNLEAWGGHAYIDYTMKDAAWKPKFTAGCFFLSGDDPDTSKNEGWKAIYQRLPTPNAVIGYIFKSTEKKTFADWTNIQLYRLMATFTPFKKTSVTLGYDYAVAFEKLAGGSAYRGDGYVRGHCPYFAIKYKINKNINTSFKYWYFIPQDFYVDTSDPATFASAEIAFKY